MFAWRELYAWFLFPAVLLLFVISFPVRPNALKSAAIGLFVIWHAPVEYIGVSSAYAAESGVQEAYRAYKNHNYVLAQTVYSQLNGYEGRMGEGASAYRRRDYLYAIKQFSAAMLEAKDEKQRATAMFNLGDSFYQAGNDRAAADAYAGVLRIFPGARHAAANLDLVAKKLAKKVKLDKYSEGILGRRGNQTGGELNVDASDVPLSIAPAAVEKGPQVQPDGESLAGVDATLNRKGKQVGGGLTVHSYDAERYYRAASKKLELVADQPSALQKELFKVDPAGARMQGEAQPW